MSQPVVQHHRRDGQQHPRRRKLRADLPHKVTGQIGVVPNAQPQPDVEDQPRNELGPCDDQRPDDALSPQGDAPGDVLVDRPNQHKQQAAQQGAAGADPNAAQQANQSGDSSDDNVVDADYEVVDDDKK